MASRLEEITEQIHTTLAAASVKRLFGPVHLAHHEQAKRVVWVRERSPIEDPRQAGGKEVSGTRIRVCRLRIEAVAAHVYAETDEALCDLIDVLIAAIDLTVPSARMSGIDWVSHQDHEAGETRRTDKAILHCAFRLPVADEIRELLEVTGIDHECGTLLPNGTVNPQPEDP